MSTSNSGGGRSNIISTKTALLATASVGILCVVFHHRTRLLEKLRYTLDFRNPLRHRRIQIIETAEECQRVVNDLKSTLSTHKVLGFDCEWVTVGGNRRPVALLQLASHEGVCALFRLCKMQQIPKSLRELLEDEQIIKVGVGPIDDAQKISFDYGVGISSTFDLRFLTAMTGHSCDGLAKLSKALLHVELDKNWRIACSDWEAPELNDKQLIYAANDALVAVEIFEKLVTELEPRSFWQFHRKDFAALHERLEPFFELRFKNGWLRQTGDKAPNTIVFSGISKKMARNLQNKRTQKQSKRGLSTRAKALYDNCLLEAPDGELLCTIDRRKAQWYLEQQLGTEVKAEPFTVRLNFEPAGRAVGEVGLYYQTPKENQCVVCGRRDAYIRKNVVPREYRKHFPVVMKTHTSHDVLLLCPSCHQLSNASDLKVRHKLAEKCGAPFTFEDNGNKLIEVPELKKVKSAARALLKNGEKIPPKRGEELRQIVVAHFGNGDELLQELLEEAANMETNYNNEDYCHHGARVVQKYQTDFGGLIELERLWREHFLHTMRPQYLPKLWNVNHNANRLEIRANEGRVDKQDLLLAGLDGDLLTNDNESSTHDKTECTNSENELQVE